MSATVVLPSESERLVSGIQPDALGSIDFEAVYRCKSCRRELPGRHFPTDLRTQSGLYGSCRACVIDGRYPPEPVSVGQEPGALTAQAVSVLLKELAQCREDEMAFEYAWISAKYDAKMAPRRSRRGLGQPLNRLRPQLQAAYDAGRPLALDDAGCG
jgi:hypothetical protein